VYSQPGNSTDAFMGKYVKPALEIDETRLAQSPFTH
jgi:hypothetical protein